jgi:hypothetical protein
MFDTFAISGVDAYAALSEVASAANSVPPAGSAVPEKTTPLFAWAIGLYAVAFTRDRLLKRRVPERTPPSIFPDPPFVMMLGMART